MELQDHRLRRYSETARLQIVGCSERLQYTYIVVCLEVSLV